MPRPERRTDVSFRQQGGAGFSATNFFQYTIGIILIVVFAVVYKLVMRTPWRDPAKADLVTGRRPLTVEELQQLDSYYALPTWRRLWTYVKLW